MGDEADYNRQIEELRRKLKELEDLYRRLTESKNHLIKELEKLKAAFHQG